MTGFYMIATLAFNALSVNDEYTRAGKLRKTLLKLTSSSLQNIFSELGHTEQYR